MAQFVVKALSRPKNYVAVRHMRFNPPNIIPVGRKRLRKGYIFEAADTVSRRSSVHMSGVMRRSPVDDAMFKVPPPPKPRRPTFRDPLTKRSRIPPNIEYAEDRVARRYENDADIRALLAGRLSGERSDGLQGTARAASRPFDTPAESMAATLRHGPGFGDVLRRRFVKHVRRLEGKGVPEWDAFSAVKLAFVQQYVSFEERHIVVLRKAAESSEVELREAVLRVLATEEHAVMISKEKREQFLRSLAAKRHRDRQAAAEASSRFSVAAGTEDGEGETTSRS